jgi:hypothetical protein
LTTRDRRPSPRAIATVAGAVAFFLTYHVRYLPASLEDLDSINFALGVRRFDVALHQPHPPGYPVYIAVAKIVASFASATSVPYVLGAISAVAGTLGIVALVWLFERLSDDDRELWPAIAAAAIAISAPLYWVMAARPLSDTIGLVAAVAVQAMTLTATTDGGLVAAAACAGLAAGIRSQVLWLTVPLIAYRCLVRRPARAPAVGAALVGGIVAWFVPMVVATGGFAVYRRALVEQGAEDLSGIRMLWTTPTPRALIETLYFSFVAPWAIPAVAAVVLVFAAAGLIVLARRRSPSLGLIAIAFGPYLVFDMLFQEFVTVRYALPLVVPIAWLATTGMRTLPRPAAVVAIVAIVMLDAHLGGRSIAALSREPAPIFRALHDMARTARDSAPVVLAPDRRQSFDLRRPLVWLGDQAPRVERQLPSPPQHEWLEAVRYWDSGGRSPVWFVVDPRRAAIDLVQHRRPAEYRWSLPYPALMSGTRPNDLDWYRVDRPEWYVGEGWSLTPESAGVADADRRGLAFGPIEGRIRRDLAGGLFVFGGRAFDLTARPRLTASVAGRTIADVMAAPGPFLVVGRLPTELSAADGSDYLRVTVTADPPARVGIEQFDASVSRPLLGFGAGWHERELNPTTGDEWRWMSDRVEIQYTTPPSGAVLRIEGESPRKYYPRDSQLIVRSGATVLLRAMLPKDFSVDVAIPPAAEPSTLVIETDQTHVPAEGRWCRSGDRRRLGLRIFKCEFR